MRSASGIDSVRWAVKPYSWAAACRLAETLRLPFAAAVVLAGRGLVDPEQARRFLECAPQIPDPFLFAHMEAAVVAVERALRTGGRVVIHGDYDADGITATATLALGLRQLGLQPECYLPSRFREGYGLSRTAVEEISAGGPGLLITVDCGINYPDEVTLAQERGLEVVVIDHHHPGLRLPECLLVHEAVGSYPRGQLCGVGLALKVLHALYIALRGAPRDRLPEELLTLLDLVAVGTIADLVPLVGENRYYVSEGLKLLSIGSRVGLRALSEVSGCTGAVDSSTVAFRLAPRLNAAGRLADPWPPLHLLLTEDEAEARRLANRLHELNGARQDVERQILQAAIKVLDEQAELPPVIVLAGEEWHEGVVGIVASRLVERYYRPTILLGVRDGVAKGSGRSISQYNLIEGLDACAEFLTVYGGHPQAAGLTLPAERVEDFRRSIVRHAADRLDASALSPRYRADVVLRGEDLTVDTALALASLGPFGLGNPRPRLLLVGAGLPECEQTRSGTHLRLTVELDGVKTPGIAFGMGELAAQLQAKDHRHVVGGQFRTEMWQGTLRTDLLVERVECEESAELCLAEPDWREWEQADDGDSGRSQAHPEGAAPLVRNPRRCSSPFSPASRDLRDRAGCLSALAQVVATGEPTLIVAGSVWWWLPHLGPTVRLCLGSDRRLVVLPHGHWNGTPPACEIRPSDVVLTEWEALAGRPELLGGRQHVVVAGPPLRAGHLHIPWPQWEKEAHLHLYYGRVEREMSERLLRYSVHPRFGLVCLYRALQAEREEAGRMSLLSEGSGCDHHSGPNQDVLSIARPESKSTTGSGPGSYEPPSPTAAVLLAAAKLGWKEARVVLRRPQLERAWAILLDAGLERGEARRAKLEPEKVTAYRLAEAEYEECLRLCRSL